MDKVDRTQHSVYTQQKHLSFVKRISKTRVLYYSTPYSLSRIPVTDEYVSFPITPNEIRV